LVLEDNRSLSDKSPEEKLTPTEDNAREKRLSVEELQKQKLDESFIEKDWEYWKNISNRINITDLVCHIMPYLNLFHHFFTGILILLSKP
jgi:hypothetical protein